MKKTTEQFIQESKEIHKEKLSYAKTEYISSQAKVMITCPTHGDFIITPNEHISKKRGCPKCGLENKKTHKKTTEQFVKESNAVHQNKYNYSKTDYVSAQESVIITCKKHGDFSILPYAHIHQKQGCRKCGYENRIIVNKKTTIQFIQTAKEKWNYDYTSTVYANKATKIRYICKKHGEIEQLPNLHLKSGCPYCNGRGISRHTAQTFINLANAVHNNRYNYSHVVMNKITDMVDIECLKHGIFKQKASNHLHLRNGCPQCNIEKTSSRQEKEISEFIKKHYFGEVLENNRKILDGKEIDVYIPEFKVGIEYHGEFFHVETSYGRYKHWQKANLAHEKGIRLIQIFGHEWQDKRDIIESKILYMLGLNDKIYARKTTIKRLSSEEKNEFLIKNHMQGSDGISVAYGLFYKEELVACMSFGRSRFNKNYDYELIRYCTKRNVAVVGGASKLLKVLRREFIGSVISYADRRWSDGNLYKQIGFLLEATTRPSFSYYHISSKAIYNRMKFQKQHLKSMNGYSEELKEYEIMQLNGYDRLWDAGQLRFVLQ